MHPKDCACWICNGSLAEPDGYPWFGVAKNPRNNSPEPPPEDYDDSLPSLEAGDWHDGPHEYEDGYDDDGQGIVCVKCAAAKREAKNER